MTDSTESCLMADPEQLAYRELELIRKTSCSTEVFSMAAEGIDELAHDSHYHLSCQYFATGPDTAWH